MDYTVWLKKCWSQETHWYSFQPPGWLCNLGSSTELLKPSDKRESEQDSRVEKGRGDTCGLNSKLTGFYECLKIKGN